MLNCHHENVLINNGLWCRSVLNFDWFSFSLLKMKIKKKNNVGWQVKLYRNVLSRYRRYAKERETNFWDIDYWLSVTHRSSGNSWTQKPRLERRLWVAFRKLLLVAFNLKILYYFSKNHLLLIITKIKFPKQLKLPGERTQKSSNYGSCVQKVTNPVDGLGNLTTEMLSTIFSHNISLKEKLHLAISTRNKILIPLNCAIAD